MQQIPRHQLRRWSWYAGRGRNGNVGMWNGEEFLVVTATLRPSIKQEPYFDADGGCFQPFLRIDEGEVLEPFREQELETPYATDMVYGAECVDEFDAVIERASGLPVVVGGTAAVSLSLGSTWPLAEVALLVAASHAASVVPQLPADSVAGGGRSGAAGGVRYVRLTVSVQVLPDEVMQALSTMTIRCLPGRSVALSPSGVLCCCLWQGAFGALPLGVAERSALEALDCLQQEEVAEVEAVLASRGWQPAQELLAEWRELALRRRWSWSEVVLERRRLRAERFPEAYVSPCGEVDP